MAVTIVLWTQAVIFQMNTISFIAGTMNWKDVFETCVALTNNTENLEFTELLLSFYYFFYFSGPGCSKVG